MPAPLVLINNVYSFRNHGDSAIVEAMAGFVRQLAPDARICLLSQFWQENKPYYQRWGLDSAPPLWDVPMDDNKVRRLARAGGSIIPPLLRCRRLANPTLGLYQEASLILDAGGGSLFSSNRYAFYLGLYQHLFNLWMGVRLRKPVVIAPQSIGPFNKAADIAAVRAVLRRAQLVMVREPISAALLAGWGVPCRLVPDAAFLDRFLPGDNPRLPGVLADLDAAPAGTCHIGVTVLDWAWAYQGPRPAARLVEEYLDKLAVALEQIARRHAVRIHIIPQVTAGFRDSDRRVSLALRERLAGRVGHVAVIDADLVAADLKQLYGRLHVLIGSRMHSAILAMLAGTPTLGLAYQPKTVGVFAFTGLDDWVLDIAEFAADDLAGRLHRILTDLAAARQRVRAAAVTAQAAVADAFRRELAPWLGGTVPAPPDSRP